MSDAYRIVKAIMKGLKESGLVNVTEVGTDGIWQIELASHASGGHAGKAVVGSLSSPKVLSRLPPPHTPPPSTHSPNPSAPSYVAYTHERDHVGADTPTHGDASPPAGRTNKNQPFKTAPQPRSRSWGGATNLELFGKQEQLSSRTMLDFMDAWNGTVVLPKIVSMKGREKVLHELMKDEFFREHWRAGVRRVAASKFCRGHNRKGTGMRPWKASVDWFLQSHVLPRILEGMYDDENEPQVTPDDQKFSVEEF